MTPQYSTKLFTNIWVNEEDFISDVKSSPLNLLSDSSLSVLFYLLYAKYGNSPIANNDENQFKFKVYSVIYQYGPTWEKRVEIQKKIRELNEEEIRVGNKAIYNRALNPSTDPSTCTLDEILTINEQNTQGIKRSKLEGYSLLLDLLETDVTGEFISKFSICFKQFVMPEHPILYESEKEGE